MENISCVIYGGRDEWEGQRLHSLSAFLCVYDIKDLNGKLGGWKNNVTFDTKTSEDVRQ